MAEHEFKDHPEEIEKLAQEAQKGHTESFAKLYDFYVQPIYRYIFFKVKKEEAFDLTEAVFLKVWENLKLYKKGAASFSAWIFRIAHNVVIDHYRSHRDSVVLDYSIPDEKRDINPVYLTESSLQSETLREAIARLNRKYQQILLLKYVNDLDNAEIAMIMKKSEGSLRILKFRALKALKRVLEEMNVTY